MKVAAGEMTKIHIARAHRIGKSTKYRTRNIVIKLNSRGKSIIMKHLKNLDRGSTVKVVEQFTPEVHAKRDKLWPMYIEAKQQGKPARWNIDQLNMDGRTVRPPKDRNRDINMDTNDVAMKMKVKHIAMISKENNHFQAHTVQIASVDDVVPAIKAMCADSRVAGASHVMYAYNWEDDGEWGGARWIMGAIQQRKTYNQLVCVTRWFGGRNMGQARFDTIKELSNIAIDGL